MALLFIAVGSAPCQSCIEFEWKGLWDIVLWLKLFVWNGLVCIINEVLLMGSYDYDVENSFGLGFGYCLLCCGSS